MTKVVVDVESLIVSPVRAPAADGGWDQTLAQSRDGTDSVCDQRSHRRWLQVRP